MDFTEKLARWGNNTLVVSLGLLTIVVISAVR